MAAARPRALVLAASLLAFGCGAAPQKAPVLALGTSHERAPTMAERKAAACRAALAPDQANVVASADAPDEHRVVRRVEIRDSADRPVEEALLRELPLKPGEAYDASHGRDAVRRIWSTGRYIDVAIDAKPDGDGVAIVFRVTPRSTIERLFVEGAADEDAQSMHAREGAAYEPVALYSAARAIEGSYRDRGYLDARLQVGSAYVGDGRVDVCVSSHLGPLVTIASIDFTGTTHEAELRALITSADGKNAPGGVLDRDSLDHDVLLMAARLYDLGYLAHKLSYHTERRGDQLRVSFEVEEGGVYRVDKVEIRGDLNAPRAAYERLVSSKRGDVFNRSVFASDLDALRGFDASTGRKEIDLEPQTQLDPDKHVVDVTIEMKDPNKAAAPAAGSTGAAAKLQIVDLQVGHGRQARPGTKVSVHYKGKLTSGVLFDSSIARGTPFVFVLGRKTVIPGFEQGVLGMRVGGKRRVTIPPDLGYGDRGAPPTIPPKATLVFELELLSVEAP